MQRALVAARPRSCFSDKNRLQYDGRPPQLGPGAARARHSRLQRRYPCGAQLRSLAAVSAQPSYSCYCLSLTLALAGSLSLARRHACLLHSPFLSPCALSFSRTAGKPLSARGPLPGLLLVPVAPNAPHRCARRSPFRRGR